MLTFFGTIIIVYVLWLVVKPLAAAYMRRKFAEKVNDAFRRQYEQAWGSAQAAAGQRREAPRRPDRSPRRKVFTREDGEYIEFEEVDCTVSSSTVPPSSHTPREPQVSDAEWEEIR